jgi:hypothetical protein
LRFVGGKLGFDEEMAASWRENFKGKVENLTNLD